MNYKIAVIGNGASVSPFTQIGIDTFPACAGEELALLIARLAKDGYAVLFICEDCLSGESQLLKNYDRESRVAIIPIPSLENSTEIGIQRIQDMVEKALGKNIL